MMTRKRSSRFRAFMALYVVSAMLAQVLIPTASTLLFANSEEPVSFSVSEETTSASTEILDIDFQIDSLDISVLEDSTEILEVSDTQVESITFEGLKYTFSSISTGQTYSYPLNSFVSINFSSIPEGENWVSIEKKSLVIDGEDYEGYEFKSNMENGTFAYTMTLPNPFGNEAQALFSEDGQSFNQLDNYTNGNIVVINSNHFTVFVVVAPTSNTSDSTPGSVTWVNPGNVYIQDGSNARTNDLNNSSSEYLIANNFGLSLPTDITIEGIEARVVRSPRFGGDADGIFDNSIRIVKNGIITGHEKANTVTRWPNGNSTAVYGGPLDVWGESWNAADLNSNDFGIAISVNQPAGPQLDQRARVDYVEITIYYNTHPTITLMSPNGGEIFNGGSNRNITWTASDLDLTDVLTIDLEYSSDSGVTWNTIATGLANTGSYSWATPVIDSQQVLVRATVDDGSVGVSDTSDAVFEIDSTDPSLDVTNPIDSGYTNLNIIDIRASVEDTNLFRYYYNLRDTLLASISSNTIYPPSSFVDQTIYTFDATAYPDGVYSLQLRARDIDASGNDSEINTTFIIDRVAPVLVFNNDVSTTPTLNDVINVTATDLNLDTATIEYGFSADAVCDSSDIYGNSFTNTTDFSITSSANNGQYLCVRATDLAGNTGYAISSNVLNIDDTLPTIGTVSAVTTYASAYVRGNGTGFDIRMPATDANGITSCEYSLDGGSTWTAGTYNTVPATDRCEGLDVNAADGAVLTITMRATDGAGNSAVGTSIVRTADSVAPSVTSFAITPVVSGFTSSNPTLNFTVSDTVSPINRCEYRYRVTGSGGAGWSAWTLASIITPGTNADCSVSITGLTDATSYDFQVRGRDSVNRNSAAANLTYVVDATVPNTVFTSPANGSFWNTPIPVEGNSTDNLGVDLVTLEYSVAGANAWMPLTTIDNVANDTPFNWTYSWTPSEGIYDIRAFATDVLGNIEMTAYAYNVTYDITDPVVNITSPIDGSIVNGTIEVRGSVQDANPWRYYAVIRNASNTVVAGPGTVYDSNPFTDQLLFNWNTTLLADGTYYVHLAARDQANNRGAASEQTIMVYVDNTEPETVLNPYGSAYTNDNTPTFTGNATDNLTNVVSVEYRYSSDGGGTWSTWMAAIANDTFDSNSEGFSFTTGALPDGDYIFQTRATDGAGNVESITNDASQQLLTIDTTAPTAVIPEWGYDVPGVGYVSNSGTGLTRQVACGGFINTTDLYRGLWAESTDLSGILRYERDVVYNGSFVGTYNAATNYTGTFTPFAGVGANGGEGTYAVRIRAIDNAGNASIDNTTWANKTVDGTWCTMTIDVTDPVTILNAPSANPTNDNTPSFTGTATENLTNIFNVEFRYSNDGGSTWTVWAGANADDGFYDTNTETFNFTTGILADGDYIFQVRGTDFAGNIESVTNDASQQLLTIDTVAPVVTIDYLETRDRTPELTGTVDDPAATISVTVNGNTYTATNNGDGTWTLVDGSIPTNLPNRYYDVVVTATDAATNVGTDSTTLDLIVDRIQPALTLTSLSGGEYLSGPFVVSGTLSDPLLSDGNPGVGIMDLRVRFRRESDNVLVATCWAVYDSMTNSYTLNVNDGGSCNVPDGEYLIRLRARDNLTNTRWLTINNVTIDNVIPTVTSLPDTTFNEGDTMPALSITGTDETRIDRLCFYINSSPLGFIGLTCLNDDGNVNTNYTWNLADYISYAFVDTSMFPEGSYDVRYYVFDTAGNSSAVENVIYTIVNVAPVVSFGSDQTINEGENATFTASFTDPSSNDSGDMTYDDTSWSATVDYGDGSAVVNLGDFATPGSISIPNHTYVNNGTYIATLEVCEEDPIVNTESEGDCTVETVTVTVNNVVPSVLISASPSTSVLAGTNVTLTADVSANVLPGNQIASYLWLGDCSGASATFVLGTPTARAYNCTVTVTDVDGDTATANITISASNGIPSVVIIANPGVNVTTGTVVTLIGNILGGDANFSYVWSGACSGSGTNAGGLTNTTTVPTTPGSYYCRIDITDANGDTAAAGVIVAVNNASTGGGVGGAGEVLGANTGEDDTGEKITEEENVLGQQDFNTCDLPASVTGTFFVDENKNGEFNQGERTLSGVRLTIRTILGELVTRITTNVDGEYVQTLCAGTYEFEIDESTIDSGLKTDKLKTTLVLGESDQDKSFDFVFELVEASEEGGFNWLILLIILLVLAALGGGYYASTRKKDQE